MARQKQLVFDHLDAPKIKKFGGIYLKGNNPKTKRPITTKKAMHLVIRSSQAKGSLSLLRKERAIYRVICSQAEKHGVKVYRFANGGNHLHMIIKPCSRTAFNAFVRSVTGLVAREVLGKQRGSARNETTPTDSSEEQSNPTSSMQEAQKRFWDLRPFTRIVEGHRDYVGLCAYLDRNSLEAWGFIPYSPRGKNFRASRMFRATTSNNKIDFINRHKCSV